MSRRNRGRRPAAQRPGYQLAKAPPPAATGISLTGDQLAVIMQASRGGQRAALLPRNPQWDTTFGPGQPLRPAPINVTNPRTGRAEPRLWEAPVSWNLDISPRTHVPWATLDQAAEMALFRKCIERRKSVCQLGYAVTVDPRYVAREADASGQAKTDVESALRKQYQPEIARISDWLAVPDQGEGHDWGAWTGLLMENMLRYDAAVVYPRRTYGGDMFAFEVIPGKTIKPLLSERGGRPLPPFPAYQQVLWGFPRGEFTADTDINDDGTRSIPGAFPTDQLLYKRRIIRPGSPYGMSATEIALLDGLLWMRRFGWILAEYTDGVQPSSFLKNTGETDWTPEQWELFATLLNQKLSGNTAERMQWPMLPPGVEPVQSAEQSERYRPDYDRFLITLVAADFGLPASEIGHTETGALGASFHEGEEDILNRQTRKPDADWLSGIATELAVRQLGMPPQLVVQILGLESEDEAAADAVASEQVGGARMTINEDRARRGLPAYDFEEADMPMLLTQRGVVFLEGASKQAPPGTMIGPAVAPPAGGEPGQDPSSGAAGPGQPDDDEDGPAKPKAGAKTAEKAALRRFLAKERARPFTCTVLTAADVPELAGDPRVVLKDGRGKALAGTGPAGSGTWTS